MFGIFRRRRTEQPVSLLGRDIGVLASTAVQITTDVVLDQKKRFEESWGPSPSNWNPGTRSDIRFATDEFVAGYVVGVANRFVRGNGRDVKEIPFPKLLKMLEEGLGEHFPGLDIRGACRDHSERYVCGVVMGDRDPGRNEEFGALESVWGAMDMHNPSAQDGMGVAGYANEYLDVNYIEFERLRAVGADMFARFASKQKR